MANSQTIIRTLTFSLTAVAAVFAVLATAGNYWIDVSKSTHSGLWKGCFLGACYEMGNDYDKLNAERAFMILACIAFGAGFAYVILLHIKRDLNVKFLGLILLVAGICETIALSIYTDEKGPDNDFYGWSYILGWVSVALAVVASVLAVVSSGDYIRI